MLASADSSGNRSDTVQSPSAANGGGPVRSCRVCRRKLPKAELTRWVLINGALVTDERGTLAGRGWYSCGSACSERLAEVVKKSRKR